MTCQHCTSEATVEVYFGESVCAHHAEVLKSYGWKSIKETCICEEVDRFPISEYRDNSLCLLHHPKEITTDGVGKRIVRAADNILAKIEEAQIAVSTAKQELGENQ